jgi:hypothetical protein
VSRPVAPCGTNSAFQRHVNRGEPVDQPCSDAHKVYMRAWKGQRGPAKLQQAALEQLADEYPERFREICADLVTGGGS